MSPLSTDRFRDRHIGPREEDAAAMLEALGLPSMTALIAETVPEDIRLGEPLELPPALSEAALLEDLREVEARNSVCKSYIGMGYHDCFTPSVILRNILENPGWYTPYTPYQAEIAQGRLEALLNFQTMVMELTGMEAANASLLDEATAAAEAMTMMHRLQNRKSRSGANTFFVSHRCFPQTLELLRCRAEPLGIELVVGDCARCTFGEGVFGALIQYPDDDGAIHNLHPFIGAAHEAGVLVAVATDLLALALLKPPGEAGADIVLGNSQRFGVPLGYGGPHAAFFACRERFLREAPGRIIGVSIDRHEKPAYRMALQTREQHIRREKAKSNICTAQALLASIAGMYAVFHGPGGLIRIARRVHGLAKCLESALGALGYKQHNECFFDTLKIELGDVSGSRADRILQAGLAQGMNFRHVNPDTAGIALNETTTPDDVRTIIGIFAAAAGQSAGATAIEEADLTADPGYPDALRRTTPPLQHDVFGAYRSETELMRYIRRLERKDVGLDTSMIPLGSCTMKLNAATEMLPVTWPGFSKLHPFAPIDQAKGYLNIFEDISTFLCRVTGFDAVSLQPNSGAQGEYAGLMVIRAYHRDSGQAHRDVVLIPASAHGTNPASAVMAGMRVVVVKSDDKGYIEMDDLRAKAEEHRDRLSALMVTYPSTHGIFEEQIREVCALIHENGGQVYMDGANLNAQVGVTNPAIIGADVCHINLHKTFSIPHGGGGPGMGPIAVARHLAPFLPGHPIVQGAGGDKAIPAVSATPWGSSSILLISYAYIRMMGGDGLTAATEHAILNANYVKGRLEKHYDVHCTGARDRVAHELIFDVSAFKHAGITEIDVAKRLMDYGFHAPTVAWPIPGTMMIEPTESESKEELDRFCDALICIREEIQAVQDGKADPNDNVLVNAPHTAAEVTANEWSHPYSREEAAFPLPFVRENKVWPAVARVDNTYGDKHLVCSCPAVSAYE